MSILVEQRESAYQKEKIMGKITRFVFQSCLTLFCLVASCDQTSAQYQATVSSQSQQTIKGWGVFPAWPGGLRRGHPKSPPFRTV